MSRVLETWRSWSLRRRLLLVGGALVLAVVAGVILYNALKRPGDITNPSAVFKQQEQQPQKPKTTNWPVYGFDDQRTRYLPAHHLDPPFGKPLWEFEAGRLLEFSPILVNKTLYVMDKAAIIYALRASNGKVIWKHHIGQLNASAPAYSHGMLFASTLEPGEIVGMRARDGHEVWRHPLPGRTETSPIVYKKNKVIVGCECGDVLALNAKTGDTVWSVPTDGPVKGGVALDRGTVFAGNYAGQLFAIDASDGSVRWESDALGLSFGRAGSFYSTPAVAFGRVYAGNLDGRIYSFVENTGELAWSHTTGGRVYPGPAVADTPGTPPTVYIGSEDHNFYALDAKSGAVRWQQNIGGVVLGAGSVVGRTAYVAVIGPNIGTYGFDVKTGKKVFYGPLGEYNPVISNGQRVFLTGSSKIVALKPKPKHKKQGGGGKSKSGGKDKQGHRKHAKGGG
jgi:outer membrane protein assembly factor BamB